MNRKFSFSVEEFYHLYNRGNEKRTIFLESSDYRRFMRLLFLCNSKNSVSVKDTKKIDFVHIDRGDTLVDIGAYCLMPNHFHLLVHEKVEGGISLFMKKLATGYSMYFNKRNERTGKLFEGPFKATHADSDNYLKYLFSYIHLNPIKIIDSKWKENGITNRTTAREYLKNYQYSSYLDYMGKQREEGLILNREAFPEYFEDIKEFSRSADEWLSFKNSL